MKKSSITYVNSISCITVVRLSKAEDALTGVENESFNPIYGGGGEGCYKIEVEKNILEKEHSKQKFGKGVTKNCVIDISKK